ncbi:MAG: hypothetical protein WAW61_05985 [Methylococcaceae bacterium]
MWVAEKISINLSKNFAGWGEIALSPPQTDGIGLKFHTKIPWLPKTLHRVLLRLLGHTFWSREDNLNLLSKRQLIILAREALGAQFTIQVERIWTLWIPSNLVLLAVRREI